MGGLVKGVTHMIGGLFGLDTPEAPEFKAPTNIFNQSPPTIEDADAAARERADELRRRKGHSANIFAGRSKGRGKEGRLGTSALLSGDE